MKQAVLQMLLTASINLDKDNPRIKHYLEQYREISSELIALALSDNSSEGSSTTYHSLRDSIKENSDKGLLKKVREFTDNFPGRCVSTGESTREKPGKRQKNEQAHRAGGTKP